MILPEPIRIGTRGSDLAMWQARCVASALETVVPNLEVEILPVTTKGDRATDRPLAEIGGTGLFVREIQDRLRQGDLDIVVHSLKDLETTSQPGLEVAAVLPRGPVGDVLVGTTASGLDALPSGARVGTGSPRRRAQLLYKRPDLDVVSVRGNVPTRIRKGESDTFDAVVLAEAGVRRLDLDAHISVRLMLDDVLPAPGQAAVAVECRVGDVGMREKLSSIHCEETGVATSAERALLAALGGGCHTPVAAHGIVADGELRLRGRALDFDGKEMVEASISGSTDQGPELARELARRLLRLGADSFRLGASP